MKLTFEEIVEAIRCAAPARKAGNMKLTFEEIVEAINREMYVSHGTADGRHLCQNDNQGEKGN